MARFLTPDWFEDINAAAAGADDAAPDVRLSLQQVVTGGPGGEVRYWVRVQGGRVATGLGELADPDVTITQPYDTAVAMSRGTLSAQAAVMTGRVRVSGNLALLTTHQGALQDLDGVFAPVRDRTSY